MAIDFRRHKKLTNFQNAILGISLLMQMQAIAAPEKNDFALDNALVPVRDIHSGGPGRDEIPALLKPQFAAANSADFLHDDDRVLGVSFGGLAKAYPIKILNYHEIVNDYFGETALTITFCPLCGTGIVFLATTGGKTRTFGVSGLLLNSDVLMYDHQSESLWSQIMGQAISGPASGQILEALPARHTSWKKWRRQYPLTLALTPPAGYGNNYKIDPYAEYVRSSHIWFPVANRDRRYPNKSIVIGLVVGDETKAYPFSELPAGKGSIQDQFAGQLLTVEYDHEVSSAHILDSDGKELPSVTGFWFAWIAFHPETKIYLSR